MSSATLQRIPAHLRRFVVQQDYAQYTEMDQAVWRFVLLQMFARLRETAHEAYGQGLSDTGMSVERIPRIRDMDECLSRFGWGAVCVDGFIPPRAFQEFQALGVLPIAADVRSVEHLAYTPAPDIIHEAAGHAPILVASDYARYLKEFGTVGAKAFSSSEDRRVYQAIFDLSEIKEDPASTPEQVAAAEQRLERAVSAVTYVTEAARLARLYWWTAEYGLVGTPREYRLYGAGLLSSLGESHFCHREDVKKIPLGTECMNVDYDITRPQPQLFVARDFAHLSEVLQSAAAALSHRVGGAAALPEARRSGEVCTIEVEGAADITGILDDFLHDGGTFEALSLSPPCALSREGCILQGFGPAELGGNRCVVLFGPLEDGRAFASIEPEEIRRILSRGGGAIRMASGVALHGAVERTVSLPGGSGLALSVDDCRVEWGDRSLFDGRERCRVLLLDGSVRTAFAGASAAEYYPETEYSRVRVPRPRALSNRSRELLNLYERAVEIWRARAGSDIVPVFTDISERLSKEFPEDWLLRWNLLESLIKIGQADLGAGLYDELERLEVRYQHAQPIAMGLRYLSERVGRREDG